MTENEQQKPWATTFDKYGDPTGELVGSTEGLRRLRGLIDEALAKGEVSLEPGAGFDFEKIRVSSKHSKEEAEARETPARTFSKFGCLAIIVILGLIALLGLIKGFEIIFS